MIIAKLELHLRAMIEKMEPEQYNEQEVKADRFASLKTVTPLSKYLAMVLFILLPFVGGWIGYQFAPEKIVEVEKGGVKDAFTERSNSASFEEDNSSRAHSVEVPTYSDILRKPNGYNPFTLDPRRFPQVINLPVNGIHYNNFETSVIFEPQRLPDTNVTVSGEFEISQNAQALAIQVMFRPDAESLQKLPWSFTHQEPIAEYAVGSDQWGLNPQMICETKERCNKLFTLLDNIERQTLRINGTGTVSVLRQFVDDRRSEYNGQIADGLIEFKEIQLQSDPFALLVNN